MRGRGLLGVGIAVVLLVSAFVTPAGANNLWNGYHWATPNRNPLNMVNTISTNLTNFPDVGAAIDEWAQGNTGIEPALATDGVGPVTISAKLGGNYLGLAQIWLENGHITKGKVVLNSLYYGSLSKSQWDHVLCQEIGHVLGLDHSNATGTCMNDHILTAPQPDQHDYQMLAGLYTHADDTGGGGDDGGGGSCPGKKKSCRNGQWITVHVFPAPSR